MVHYNSVEVPFFKIVIATSSRRKTEENKRNINTLAKLADISLSVNSFDPEVFVPESDSHLVDVVAWKKTEALRINRLPDSERELIVAFDVSTAIAAKREEDINPTQATDLKRMLRDIHISEDGDAQEQWNHIIEVIEAEKIRMLEFCTQGRFCIEWHVGFAVNSTDGIVSNRGVLVLRATFNPLDPDIIFNAFTLSDELEEMKNNGLVPTHQQLVNGMQAFAIGPRITFAELLGEYANQETLVVSNRDYPGDEVTMNPEQFLRIVRDCALPPHLGFQLLAGSLDPEMTPERHLSKPTIKFDLDT
jgi:hypothetical protein